MAHNEVYGGVDNGLLQAQTEGGKLRRASLDDFSIPPTAPLSLHLRIPFAVT